MTFVDDHRVVFDAADFCATLKAAVGDARLSTNHALQNSHAVAAANQSLRSFLALAASSDAPDVVAAYVAFSPAAVEVFTALRATAVDVALVSAALDCLIRIVRYSLDQNKPRNPLDAARSIVKEVVKTRAVLIYDILVNDDKACAKKALDLLRLVATCHSLLAKELVNRFDLTAPQLAPSLCTLSNNHCRVPFLDLMFTLLTCGERDVLHYFTTRGRQVIVTCFQTIQNRTALEASANTGSSKNLVPWKQRKLHGKKQTIKVLPSHLQKRELVAAINFLLACENHLFVEHDKTSRRHAFAHPIPSILSSLASTPIPPLDIAPREVVAEHEALRSTASRMFISVARDPNTSADHTVRALNNPAFNFGRREVVQFITKVIQEKPGIAKPMLESGRILASPPALTTRWLGYFSVIAACIIRLSAPVTTFKEKQFFEKCLTHPDSLIRHFGSTLAVSFCKVVEKLPLHQIRVDDYLPSVSIVQRSLSSADSLDDASYKLVACYQSLFQKDMLPADLKLMTTSVDSAGDDIGIVVEPIRRALKASPYHAARKVIHRGYLAKLIIKASELSETSGAERLWRVCILTLQSSGLFPPGTEAEIDIFLSVLSSLGSEIQDCATAFEAMISQAVEMPYGLYDRLYSEEWCEQRAPVKTSLLAVAALIKLQKLRKKIESNEAKEKDVTFSESIETILFSIVSARSLISPEAVSRSYLVRTLSSLKEDEDSHWRYEEALNTKAKNNQTAHHLAIKLVRERRSYPRTTFLNLVDALVRVGDVMAGKDQNGIGIRAIVESGLAWDAWCRHWASPKVIVDKVISGTETESHPTKLRRDTIISQGLLGLLFRRYYPQPGFLFSADPSVMHKMLRADHFRFAVMMLTPSAHGEDVRFFEDLVDKVLSYVLMNQSLATEEVQFIYESVLSGAKRRAMGNPKTLGQLYKFCTHVMLEWQLIPSWEVHYRYATEYLAMLTSHVCDIVCTHFRVLLSSFEAKSMPPLRLLTPRTVENVLTILNYSASCRTLAIEQVQRWSSKEFRDCSGEMLPLLTLTLEKTSRESTKVLKEFIKGTTRSHARSVWLTMPMVYGNKVTGKAVRSIATSMVKSDEIRSFFLQRLLRHGAKVTMNSWLLLSTVLEAAADLGKDFEITSKEYVGLLPVLVAHIGTFDVFTLDSPEPLCVHALQLVLCSLRIKKFSFHRMINAKQPMAQQLADLCSKLLLRAQAILGCSENERGVESTEQTLPDVLYLSSLLGCATEILRTDLALEVAAKQSLMTLAFNESSLIERCLHVTPAINNGRALSSVSTDPVPTLLSLIQAGLSWVDQSRCDENVSAFVLSFQRILSSNLMCMGYGRRERDVSIRHCLKDISNFASRNDLERRNATEYQRVKLLRPKGTSIITMLSQARLDEAADFVLTVTDSSPSHERSTCDFIGVAGTSGALDPVFVLHAFMRACSEAIQAPQAPILDLDRMVNDGILKLTLYGMASSNAEARNLSFACLESFRNVVGPILGLPVGHAAGLYKHRRQLAFLLDLLRNSIEEPMAPVLPLFAVWFHISATVLLKPEHHANKAVSVHLLRAPSLDVFDCYGLSYLMNCEVTGEELLAARLLALEVIHHGVRTQKDLAVARQKRIFDKLFMLSVSEMGYDSSIRLASLKALEAIVLREDSLEIVDELVGAHGVIPWLASDIDHVDQTPEESLCKASILTKIAKLSKKGNSDTYSAVLAHAFSLICHRWKSGSRYPQTQGAKVAEQLFEFGASVARMVPGQAGLFHTNLADLYPKVLRQNLSSEKCRQDFAVCLSRQRDIINQPNLLIMLLNHVTSLSNESFHFTSKKEIQPAELPVLIEYAAKGILKLRFAENRQAFLMRELFFALAKALYSNFNVCLLPAAFTLLDLSGDINDELLAFSGRVPADVSKAMNMDQSRFQDSFIEETFQVMHELIQRGYHLAEEPRESLRGIRMMNGIKSAKVHLEACAKPRPTIQHYPSKMFLKDKLLTQSEAL